MTVSDVILSLRSVHGPLDLVVRRHVLRLGCSRPEYRPRGCRAGRHIQARDSVYKHYVTQPCQKSIEPKAIPKIVSIRSTDVRRRLSSPCRPTLRTISCRVSSPTKVGLFNARSVASSGKSQSIATWVSELKLTAAGLVETWHDGPGTLALVACAPPGYVYTERPRPIPDDKVDTISTNHGGVCLIYRDRLYSRLVNTAQYQTFEHSSISTRLRP